MAPLGNRPRPADPVTRGSRPRRSRAGSRRPTRALGTGPRSTQAGSRSRSRARRRLRPSRAREPTESLEVRAQARARPWAGPSIDPRSTRGAEPPSRVPLRPRLRSPPRGAPRRPPPGATAARARRHSHSRSRQARGSPRRLARSLCAPERRRRGSELRTAKQVFVSGAACGAGVGIVALRSRRGASRRVVRVRLALPLNRPLSFNVRGMKHPVKSGVGLVKRAS